MPLFHLTFNAGVPRHVNELRCEVDIFQDGKSESCTVHVTHPDNLRDIIISKGDGFQKKTGEEISVSVGFLSNIYDNAEYRRYIEAISSIKCHWIKDFFILSDTN